MQNQKLSSSETGGHKVRSNIYDFYNYFRGIHREFQYILLGTVHFRWFVHIYSYHFISIYTSTTACLREELIIWKSVCFRALKLRSTRSNISCAKENSSRYFTIICFILRTASEHKLVFYGITFGQGLLLVVYFETTSTWSRFISKWIRVRVCSCTLWLVGRE